MPITTLMPLPKQQFLSVLGTPLVGGKVYTYAAGTSNPKATYTDAAGTINQPNPIPLNVRGEPASPIYWSGNYRVEVHDLLDNLVYTVDNFNTDPAGLWDLVKSFGASLIGFIQSGAGAVKRTVQDKLRETISVKDFGAVGDGVTDDTAAIQAAINAAGTDQTIYFPQPDTYYKTTSPIQLKSRIGLVGESRFGSGVVGDFDGPLFKGYVDANLWRMVIKNMSFVNNNAGANAACVQATFYQGKIEDCQFESNNGPGLYLEANDYAVGNVISDNYFYQCEYGIYAPSGATWGSTDAYVRDNEFKGLAGKTVNLIKWGKADGTVFRGNHFYSGCIRNYVEIGGGICVDIDGNYFEPHDNSRLKLSGGNPTSYIVRANRFWGGDGTHTDFNGNPSSLIELNLSAYQSDRVQITGNLFEGGANSLNILRTSLSINTIGAETHAILFSSTNTLRGSYTLGVNVFRVDCDHPSLANSITTGGQSSGLYGSLDRNTYENAGGDTVFLANNGNLNNRTWTLSNESSATTITLSTSAATVGSKKIFPGDRMEIRNVNGTYYTTRLCRGLVKTYSTAARPSGLSSADAGFAYYDNGLITPRMVFWNGTAYQDAAGTAI